MYMRFILSLLLIANAMKVYILQFTVNRVKSNRDSYIGFPVNFAKFLQNTSGRLLLCKIP